jgi:phosphatidylethanolamine N-methyltransferase
LTADVSIVVEEHPVSAAETTETDLVEGEVAFEGDKLWWTQGVFEFRYHHNGRHHAMAISEPFEIRISKFDDEDVDLGAKGLYEQAVEAALLPVVQNCLDRDPDIAPNQPEEPFGGHVERDTKYAKRIVYAIREMFGIEFAPPVVAADGSVRKLAWRVCNAKEVLVCSKLNANIWDAYWLLYRHPTACLYQEELLHLQSKTFHPRRLDVGHTDVWS